MMSENHFEGCGIRLSRWLSGFTLQIQSGSFIISIMCLN